MTKLSSLRTLSIAVAAVASLTVGARAAHAQTATITGRVASEQGQLLEGAQVLIPELNISVGSNAQGRYSMTVPAERVRGQAVTLRVRSIGYTPQTANLTLTGGAHTQDFTLKLDVNRLSEVVVTGVTGATEQKKLAFTVTTVDAKDMPVPSANALGSLQGKVPGAQIVQPSGRPGQAPAIVLRGPKSINAAGRSQGPLVVVDGIVLSNGSQDLNPEDVESIEVVKGAAAASLYGSRAGNGVIQITTKKGRDAGVRFNVRSEYGVRDVATEYPYSRNHFMLMDETNTRMCIRQSGLPTCSRTVDFLEEAFRINDQGGDNALTPYQFERDYGIGASPTKTELKGLFQVNRWPVEFNPIAQAKTPNPTSQTNVDMSGRFGNTGVFASASNYIEKGAIKFLDGYRRQTARANIDQAAGSSWSMNLQTMYSRTQLFPDGEWFRLTRVPAGVDILARDSKSRLYVRSNPLNQGSQNQNPLYTNDCCYGRTDADRFLGGFTTRWAPLTFLDLEGNASIDRRRSSGFSMTDRGFRTTTPNPSAVLGQVDTDSDSDLSYNFATSATARRDFGPNLATRFQARWTYEQQDNQGIEADGDALAVPGLMTLGNTTTSFNVDSDANSVRAMGASVAGNLEFKGRYIVDALIRRDGSSLFGENQRWHNYYRTSLAYRPSEEGWWPLKSAVNDFKLRGSLGTAGNRPRFVAQYETFSIGGGGAVTAGALGNKDLKPEYVTETEIGIDAELFNRFGLTVTYAHDHIKDQILQVPPSVSSGFSSQYQNAGTVVGKTWEVSVNLPIIQRRNLTYSARASWDRNRSVITSLNVPPRFETNESYTTRFAVGERLGSIYGKQFLKSCAQLPADFQARCGAGQDFQANDEGFIVWVGQGNTYGDGIKKNLWQAVLPGCVNAAGAKIVATGEIDCKKAGGRVNAPWGVPDVHWGMLMVMRDSTANPVQAPLGNTLPNFRWSLTQNFQYKRLSLYALVDASVGNKLMNEELHWSLGDFMVKEQDQRGKSVENAKPLGYYWRAPAPDNNAGVGGFYDVLGSNSFTVEDGTYTKLREVSVGYNIGKVRGIFGNWTLSVIGRNLYTLTDFKGWDPEVGISAGALNNAALQAVAAYQYPPTRSFTFTLQTRF